MRYTKKRQYEWSNEIGYIVGLMASDGCLSKDRRHLDLTSVDVDQLENFLVALKRRVKISEKNNKSKTTAYRVQFSDVALYDFLVKVGLTPNKSMTISHLNIPDKYYKDFLRGLYDGDGSSNAFWDARWKSSYMYYTRFASASMNFIVFIQSKNSELMGIGGGSIIRTKGAFMLSYAKSESKKIYDFMYYSDNVICLGRKRHKLESFIKTDNIAKI